MRRLNKHGNVQCDVKRVFLLFRCNAPSIKKERILFGIQWIYTLNMWFESPFYSTGGTMLPWHIHGRLLASPRFTSVCVNHKCYNKLIVEPFVHSLITTQWGTAKRGWISVYKRYKQDNMFGGICFVALYFLFNEVICIMDALLNLPTLRKTLKLRKTRRQSHSSKGLS